MGPSVASLVMSQSGTSVRGELRPRRVLAQPQIEEGVPVERLDERLHDAAHARRHPPSHHAEGQLAPLHGLEADRRELLVLGRPGRRCVANVPLAGRLDPAADPVARVPIAVAAPPRDPLPERRGERDQAIGVEAGCVEASAQAGGDTGEIGAKLGFVHGKLSMGQEPGKRQARVARTEGGW